MDRIDGDPRAIQAIKIYFSSKHDVNKFAELLNKKIHKQKQQ